MSNYSPVIDCAEESGTATESYDELNGFMKAQVTLRCAYGDRHALVADLVSNRRFWPKGSAGLTPRAVTASIRPVESPSISQPDFQLLQYNHALVTVNYSSIVVDVYTEEIEPTAEFITLNGAFFRWGSNTGLPLAGGEEPGFLVRGINFVRKDYYVFSLDPALVSLVGTVNNATIVPGLLDGFSFPEETLLFAPPQISIKYNSAGIKSYDVTKKWTYKPEGWNKYFRPATNSFENIFVLRGPVFKSYPPADHSPLF